jgi:allantoinase
MSTFDLVIRGDPDLGVVDGQLAEVGPELPGGREEIDARGLLVLPGVVDAHVHMNEPGRTGWEGFGPGTEALAAGGATCALDMPLNASPPTVDGAAFDAKLDAARAAARVDFGLWGGIVPGDPDRLDELAERGVVGFKAFMCPSGIEDFPAADGATLASGMARAARHGLPVAVHAEDPEITGQLAARALAEGRRGVRDYLASRPVRAELAAIARALALAEEAGCSLHVVHVSCAAGARLVEEARARGVDATCETCPHYLVLDEEDAVANWPAAKCAPPLRTAAERRALWEEVAAGRVDLIASDHSPAPPELKAGDAFAAWGGIAGAQTLLPLLLTHGPEHGLGPGRIRDLVAGTAAARFRLAAKGRIAPGADADLALVDPGARWRLAAGDLRSRHRLSPFLGRELRARVVRTIVRGRTVWADGAPVGPPAGRLVVPEPAAVR